MCKNFLVLVRVYTLRIKNFNVKKKQEPIYSYVESIIHYLQISTLIKRHFCKKFIFTILSPCLNYVCESVRKVNVIHIYDLIWLYLLLCVCNYISVRLGLRKGVIDIRSRNFTGGFTQNA